MNKQRMITIRPCLIPGDPDGKRYTVKDPRTRNRLKDEGEKKPRNTFWMRRIREKGCELVDGPVARPQAKAPKKDTKKNA